jgi:hypothetical protein
MPDSGWRVARSNTLLVALLSMQDGLPVADIGEGLVERNDAAAVLLAITLGVVL